MLNSVESDKIKLEELENKLFKLTPKYKHKRGLINGFGTLIKQITGNMDANDAHRLNRQIESILVNESSFKNKFRQQSKLNNQMIERFKNITTYINKQQLVIQSSQDYLKNKIRVENLSLRHIQLLNQINYNIDLLSDHLSDITDAIIARLNFISKLILNSNGLSEIHSTL